ncbi:MAG: MurR/RpiR family transcriptional regulator [Deltaproteobacteria bacterium]|nr:MAG: MurR/RpiR family transcriptional regulator [Deltaproteobacteria bacterium]
MPFEQLLKEKGSLLTRSQRRLMEFILSHEDESIFLKIEDLAARVNVSVATVVRLSKAMGFGGFPEFQKELRLLFRNKLTTTSRLQRTVDKVTNEGDVLIKTLQTDISNIEETLKQTSTEEFRRFVHAIDSAQRIIIVGLRSVYSLASFFGTALKFLQKNVSVIQPGIGDMWDQLLRLRKGDLVIGISFPRYTRETVDVIRFSKRKGITTLAVTDTLMSPLARHADHVLTAHCKMDSFIESFTAPLSLINAVVTALGVKNKKSTMNSLKELEEIWEIRQIYHSIEK